MREVPPSHSPAPGISRATAFRPHVSFRITLAVLVVVFATFTVLRFVDEDPAPAAIMLAFLLATSYAAARAWTTRVWVETTYPTGWVPGASPDPTREATLDELLADMPSSRTLSVVEGLGAKRVVPLEHPTTIRLAGASYVGVRPSWRLTVSAPDSAVTVRAPWLTDLRPLLARLHYFVAHDERLAADEDTLALVLGRRPLDEPRH